jgi:hypothetical protein
MYNVTTEFAVRSSEDTQLYQIINVDLDEIRYEAHGDRSAICCLHAQKNARDSPTNSSRHFPQNGAGLRQSLPSAPPQIEAFPTTALGATASKLLRAIHGLLGAGFRA